MPPKQNLTKAYKAMKGMGYSVTTVRPIVKQLLSLYEDNWTLIEDDNYRVLIEAILDGEDNKAHGTKSRKLIKLSGDEAEKEEPLLKRPRLNSLQKNQSSLPLSNNSRTICNNEIDNQTCGKKKMTEVTPEKHQDKDNELRASHLGKYDQRECKNLVEREMDSECKFDDKIYKHCSLVPIEDRENFGEESNLDFTWMGDDLPSFTAPLAVAPPDSPILLLQQSSYENCSNAEESCSKYPEVIDLVPEPEDACKDHDMLPKDSCSLGKSCELEQVHSEPVIYENLEAEKIEHDGQDSFKLDISTSSKGDSKISLSINASLGPDFRVPNLEAVLKQVEDQCIKLYKIPQTGFSLLELMKEVCQCFLAMGTTSTNTEKLGLENEMPTLGVSEEIKSEIGLAEHTNNQLSLIRKPTISNDPVMVKNIFEVSTQILRFFGSVDLDSNHPMIYLKVDESSSLMTDRKIKELNESGICSSQELTVFQNKVCGQYIMDITKGHEACEISLINEITGDKLTKFHYISKNVAYMTACMTFPLARVSRKDCCSDCLEDCLSLEIPCACAGKAGRELAYTQEGLVKENFLDNFISKCQSLSKHDLFYCQDCPLQRSTDDENSLSKCKGHVTRDFIKECWYKCGCSFTCGNRIVQRGITAKLQVFMTPEGKGWGLRTLEALPKGTFICEYVGEVVTIRELFERNVINNNGDNHTFPVLLDADWRATRVLKDNEALSLDATFYGNVARFINHRCFDANLVGIPVEIESPDHHYYHVAFFTTREINAMEELTWDYGVEFDGCHPLKAFDCRCGSKFCRDRGSVGTQLTF